MRRSVVVGVAVLACSATSLVLLATVFSEAAPVPKPTPDALARTALTRLTAVLPPPESPQYTGTDVEWAAAAKKMKVTFPAEYKRFVQVYGYVVVNRFLVFHTPLVEGENCGLLERVDFFREFSPKELLVWPQEGGVLPLAVTVCADTIAYRCKGKPDDWTIAVVPKGGPAEEHPFGLVEFMTRLASGKLESEMLMASKEMHPPLSFK